MIATSTTRSSRQVGRDFGSVCIWARLSTWKTPTVSAAWSIAKTSGISSGSRSRSTQTAQSCSMSWIVSSIAASIPRPSRSSLMSLSVSTSRLSNWTTTRPGIVARSSGAMSMSGAAVTSIPPVWMREVAREAVDPGAQLQPALPGRHPDGAPAARRGRRLRARARATDDAPGPALGGGRRVPVPRPAQPVDGPGGRREDARLRVERAAVHRAGRARRGRAAARRPGPNVWPARHVAALRRRRPSPASHGRRPARAPARRRSPASPRGRPCRRRRRRPDRGRASPSPAGSR